MENVTKELATDALDMLSYLDYEICRQSVLEDAVESLKKTDPENAKWLDEFFTEQQDHLVNHLEYDFHKHLEHLVDEHGFTIDPYGYHDEIEEALTKLAEGSDDK